MSELLRKSAPIHGLRAFRETDDAVEAWPESSGRGLAMAGLAFGSPRLPSSRSGRRVRRSPRFAGGPRNRRRRFAGPSTMPSIRPISTS